MSDAGGQTTHAGVGYQDKIAALFLGRMIDPRALRLPPDQQVSEVCSEKPGVEVDDVVVRFADGHTLYIQAKIALADSGKPWEKLWEHFYHQRLAPNFNPSHDRLVLWLGSPENFYKELRALCKKALSSENAAAWLERLSQDKTQRKRKLLLLLNRCLRAGTQQQAGLPQTLGDEDLFQLLRCVELRFTDDDTLAEEHLVSWMPDCNVNRAALFSHLVKLVLSASTDGRTLRQPDLLQALTRVEVLVKPLEQQSDFTPPSRCDYYAYIHLPTNLVPRPELLAEVRSTLLDNPGGVALTSALQVRALYGMGGIGKTVMARLLCDDDDVRAEYPDGALWTTLGKTPDIRQKLKEWADALEVRLEAQAPSPDQYKNALAQALKRKQVLLVVDDVWEDAHLDYFLVGGRACQHLITTRIPSLAESAGAQLCPVPAMTQPQAVALLEEWAGDSLQPVPYAEKAAVVERLCRLPLAVKLAGAKMKRMRLHNWSAQFDKLRRLDAEPDAQEPEKSLAASFQLSLDGLRVRHQQLYLALGIFPEDENIPDSAVIRLWRAIEPQRDARDCRELLAHFAGRALLERVDGQTVLHDLMRQYLRETLSEEDHRALHQRLLQAYAATRLGAGWHTAPDDGYLYAHLVYHLEKAGHWDQVTALFQDDAWLQVRVAQDGYQYTGYLADWQRLWTHAYQGCRSQIEAGQPLTGLVDCLHLALVRTSINSLSGNYIPAILAHAVELNLPGWTPQRIFSLAERSPDPEQRVALLRGLLDLEDDKKDSPKAGVPGSTVVDRALQAALDLPDTWRRAEALSGLAPWLDLEQVERALDAAHAMYAEEPRAYALAALLSRREELLPARPASASAGSAVAPSPEPAGSQPPEQVEGALQAALEIWDDEYRVEALVELWDKLRPEQIQRLLRPDPATLGEAAHAKTLSGIAAWLEGEQVESALQAALAMRSEANCADLLGSLSARLAGPQVERALQAALAMKHEITRSETLTALAGSLEGAQVESALQAALAMRDVWLCIPVLGELAESLDQAQLERAFQVALAYPNEKYRAHALSRLAGSLTASQVERALPAALAIHDQDLRTLALSALASRLDPAQLELALRAALDIHDDSHLARALGGLGGRLVGQPLEQVLQTALAFKSEAACVEALAGLAPWLEPAQLAQALHAALALNSEPHRAQALNRLGSRLVGEQAQLAFQAALAMDNEANRAVVLAGLGGSLDAAGVDRLLQAALALKKDKHRAEALSGLGSKLHGEQVALALQAALGMRDELALARALNGLGANLHGEQVARALHAALALKSERHRAVALAGLGGRLDGSQLRQAFQAATAVDAEKHAALALQGLVGRLARAQVLDALQAVLEIDWENHRASALIALAEKLEGEQVEPALQAALALQDDWLRARLLQALGPRLDGDRLEIALQAALEIQREDYRALALGGLGGRLDQAQLARARQALLAMDDEDEFDDEDDRAEAWIRLGGELDDAQFERLLKAACSIWDHSQRAAALRWLAGTLDAAWLPPVLQAALELLDPQLRTLALSGLRHQLDQPGRRSRVQQALLELLAGSLGGERLRILAIIERPELVDPHLLGLSPADLAPLVDSLIRLTTHWRWM